MEDMYTKDVTDDWVCAASRTRVVPEIAASRTGSGSVKEKETGEARWATAVMSGGGVRFRFMEVEKEKGTHP